MAQSYGRCGESVTARSLLKTSCRSWYLLGTFVRSITSRGSGVIGLFSGTAESRQCAWQYLLQPRMEAVEQSMCGLCNFSQGTPRTMGDNGDEMTNSSMNSRYSGPPLVCVNF